jgi:hypothetical protein
MFISTGKMLKLECKRRAEQLGLPSVKNSYWNRTKCVEYLVDNLIVDGANVSWLKATEKLLHDTLLAENQEREATRRDKKEKILGKIMPTGRRTDHMRGSTIASVTRVLDRPC